MHISPTSGTEANYIAAPVILPPQKKAEDLASRISEWAKKHQICLESDWSSSSSSEEDSPCPTDLPPPYPITAVIHVAIPVILPPQKEADDFAFRIFELATKYQIQLKGDWPSFSSSEEEPSCPTDLPPPCPTTGVSRVAIPAILSPEEVDDFASCISEWAKKHQICLESDWSSSSSSEEEPSCPTDLPPPCPTTGVSRVAIPAILSPQEEVDDFASRMVRLAAEYQIHLVGDWSLFTQKAAT